AGRKVGFKFPATLQKIHARELARQKITENLERLLNAQIDNAVGIRHLMMRDPKTGQFERVTGDAKQIDKALKTKTGFWIYTNDRNVQGFTDLMNRCIDKPSEHGQISGVDDGPIQIQWMTRDETADEKESGGLRELSGDVDDKIRGPRKVNGHGESE